MLNEKYLPHRKPGEKIIFVSRRHFIIAVRVFLIYLFLALMPLAIYWLSSMNDMMVFDGENISVLIRLLLYAFYLFWLLMFYHSWLDYMLDVWVVTNFRVVHVEQKGLFHRVIAEHKLFRIQDVLSQQKGFFPTLFDYGTIDLQTAGTEKTVIFKQVPKPHKIAQDLIKIIEWRKKIERKNEHTSG